MSPELQVRRFSPDDESRVIRLLLGDLPESQETRAFERRVVRWRWQYYRNPNNPDGGPVLWVAETESGTAGLICLLSVRLRTPAGVVDASWGNDWIVDPAFRGMGVGKALEEKWLDSFPIALGKGWSEVAYRVHIKYGFMPVEGFHTVYMVLSAAGFARRLLRERRHRDLAHLARAVPRWFRRRRPTGRFRVELTDELPRDCESIWARVRQSYSFAVERSFDYLKWRYADHPFHAYRYVRLVENGEPVGLAVLRLARGNPPLGVVTELLVAPEESEAVVHLVEEAAGVLKSMGACAILLDAPPKLIGPMGGISWPMFRRESKILVYAKHPEHKALEIQDASNWYISRGDSDGDF